MGTFGPPEAGSFASPDLASDGQRVVIGRIVVAQGTPDIWMIDATRGVPTRLTFGPTSDLRSYNFPVWTHDRSRVAYAARTRTTPWDLFGKSANGGQDERRLLASSDSKIPNDWSPDGRILLYANQDSGTASDLWALPLGDTQKPFPVVQTRFNEDEGQFSPDGKWIAYRSNESGSDQITILQNWTAALKR